MDIKKVELTLNAQAQVAADWYTENWFFANKDKFQTMTLNGNNKESAAINIKIDDNTIRDT